MFLRYGELTPAYGHTFEEIWARKVAENDFCFTDRDFEKEHTRETWERHHPPLGVRGVYAFVPTIVDYWYLGGEDGTRAKREAHYYAAPGRIWAKMALDGGETSDWTAFPDEETFLDALVRRGDQILADLAEDPHGLRVGVDMSRAWPWDYCHDYGVGEVFLEM